MSQYTITWDSFKNNVCSGFASLQQKEEFVDMTIAADGHFVKVHKTLIALASPYLKELMSSLPASNPVIFLHNISYEILSYILEYIYMGEIQMPDTKVLQFIAAGKSLQLSGVSDMIPPKVADTAPVKVDTQTNIKPPPSHQTTEIGITGNSSNSIVTDSNWSITPLVKIALNNAEETNISIQNIDSSTQGNTCNVNDITCGRVVDENKTQPVNYAPKIEISIPNIEKHCKFSASDADVDMRQSNINDIDMRQLNTEVPVVTDNTEVDDSMDTEQHEENNDQPRSRMQFTVSAQGSVQLILNRYVYYVHYKQKKLVRWRCVDYRRKHCTAYVDTCPDFKKVLCRKNLHTHPYHDSKILKKIEDNLVFSTVEAFNSYTVGNKKDMTSCDDNARQVSDDSDTDNMNNLE